MFTVFSFWKSFTREALDSCREDILKHNARSLLIISMVASILIVLFSFFPLLVEKQVDKLLIYLCAAVVELLVFLYANYLCRHKKYRAHLINAGFLVFYICLMGFGIYIGVIKRPQNHAAVFLVFFVCGQIIFVLSPLWNLILNVVTVALFSVLVIAIKPAVIWQSDVVNVIIAALTGIVFTRYMSQTVIREMLATRRLEIERNRFREESIRDELTGLSNRRDYLHAVDFYISVCQHVHQTVCVIMMDVDYFKMYNDFYGHAKGDVVLQSIGKTLQILMEEERVFAARVGGEEFIILWTENRIAEVERVAVKLRQMSIDLQIPHEKSSAAPCVTASLGLYILRGGSTDTTEDLYKNADAALYEAKKRGRNCIMLRDSADNTLRMVEPVPPEKNVGRR
jgi:diguanylate cyclase (GGDEF)-like protein